MENEVLEAKCPVKVVVEERDAAGAVASRQELSTALALKKEMGNARLVSDDAMLWVAHGSLQSRAAADGRHHVTVANGKRSFSFYLECNADSDVFLNELRAQVDGKSGLEARRKRRKIRRAIDETHSAGFVPVVNSLASPAKPPPLTPTKRRLSDATNSPRLAPPLPMTLSTVSEAHGVYPSPSKSPFRSPFRKQPSPPPRLASPIVSLALPPKSPHASKTPSPASLPPPSSASSASSGSSLTSPRPREWLSPSRSGAPRPVRVQLTPPAIRRDSLTPGSRRTTDSSDKENTPVRSSGGIVSKRVRSLQRMLDDVPREEPENTAGARPPIVRSPFFLSPPNAREMSPVRRPSPAKKLRSPIMPLGELSQNSTPPLRPLNSTPPSNPQSGGVLAGDAGLRKVTHGLLNLGNFCYMNAIVQSLAALPGFADRLVKDEWIISVIKKHLATNSMERGSREVAELFKKWKGTEGSDRLVVQEKLAQLLQQVIEGSDSSINPEPLKSVMGRKNPRFASHFQQDAHEFLLHLVTEYEKELVDAVQGVVKTVSDEEASKQAAQPQEATEVKPVEKKSSLLNFFWREKKEEPAATPTASAASSPPAVPKPGDEDALVAELFPAECFRTELYRTLTCCSCNYSRRQVEKFYDFSLDLPYVPLSKSPVQETLSEPAVTTKHCHCGEDAVVIESGNDQFYCCAKSTCSLRDKVETPELQETAIESKPESPSPLSTLSGPIQLTDLLKDQFKSEVLDLTCEKCKEGRQATARYEVKSLPRVLVFHLKRFEVNPETGTLYKRCDLVEAPADLLPVKNIHGDGATPSEVAELADKRYTIKSVVHHLGRTIDEGHYLADVCGRVCGRRGEWRRRNDTHETIIGEDFALRASRSQESCYMMFYVLAEPADAQERDKENAMEPAPSPARRSTSTPTHPDSPASLVGRRREMTPPRRNESRVSKSLHELL